MNSTRLSSLEADIFKSRFDDGLLDCFAGFALAVIGISWWLHLAVLGAITPALLVPLWLPLHKRLIEPRLGQVEYSARRKRLLGKSHRYALLIGAFMLVLGVAIYFWAQPRQSDSAGILPLIIPLLPGVLLGIMSVVAAQLISAARFVVYGVMIAALACLLSLGFGMKPGVYMSLAGVTVLLAGIVRVLKFIKRYPVVADESQ